MKKKTTVIFLVAAVLAALIILRYSLFTVPAGEAAIVTQFGRPVATITEPGLKIKQPGFLQRVSRIDSRIETFNTQPIQLLLGDKNPIIITTYIAWRVKDPLLFFQSLVIRDTARQKLADMVTSSLGATLADYTLENIINVDADKVSLAELEARILDSTSPQAQQKYGIEVVRIGLRRLAYPSIVAEAVYMRMQAEREKEAKKYRAEGREQAAKIEAAADKEVSDIMAQAYREAEIIKGEGDRQATRTYADAYGKDPRFFEFTKSLDLYRESLKGQTTLILSTESELFRYLDSSKLDGEK